jgi:hypothetical protein
MRKNCLALTGIRTTDHTARTRVAIEILNIDHRPRLINQHVSLIDMPPSSDGKEKARNLPGGPIRKSLSRWDNVEIFSQDHGPIPWSESFKFYFRSSRHYKIRRNV